MVFQRAVCAERKLSRLVLPIIIDCHGDFGKPRS